jgi:cysteine desulfurase
MSRNRPIYFDHNATTPIDPRVADVMRDAALLAPYNPGSLHKFGRESYGILQNAREGICRLLGGNIERVPTDRLVITSGGTESNNLILLGLPWGNRGEEDELVVSAVEHPSVLAPAQALERKGVRLRIARVHPSGLLDLEYLAGILCSRTRLVSVQIANQETGIIQPIREITDLCQQYGIPVHADAAQAVGKIDLNFRELGIDAMTIVPHKFHGPRGVGGLLVSPNLPLQAILLGGPQQGELRAGTESVASVVGFEKALTIWREEAEARSGHLEELGKRLWEGIESRCSGVRLVGQGVRRLQHTLCVVFPYINRQALAIALDLQGIACSTGSACASGSNEPSPVLLAMGLPRNEVQGAIRFSLGFRNTIDEVDEAILRIERVYRQLRSSPKTAP